MSAETPYLFDELAEAPQGDLDAPCVQATSYMSPQETLAFDIMEALDLLFKKEITIEQYDAAQTHVKKMISEALGEKDPDTLGNNGLPLLVVRHPDTSR